MTCIDADGGSRVSEPERKKEKNDNKKRDARRSNNNG